MRYQQVIPGRFIDRPNRFIAHVETADGVQRIHVKNTGRCRELLRPGVTVYLERGTAPNRKTPYDLIAVEKNGKFINMDAQAPNKAFAEWALRFDPTATAVHSEYRFGQSRLDFCLETPKGLHLVEVKGVTLEENGHVRFPDAPTERGVKHLHELIHAVELGHQATAFFVIQMAEVLDFSPNDVTHPAFGAALRQAKAAGVGVEAWCCRVTPDSMEIDKPVKVVL